MKKKKENKNKMADLNPNIPLILLNTSGLNTPSEKQRLVKYIKIARPNYRLSTRNLLQ